MTEKGAAHTNIHPTLPHIRFLKFLLLLQTYVFRVCAFFRYTPLPKAYAYPYLGAYARTLQGGIFSGGGAPIS